MEVSGFTSTAKSVSRTKIKGQTMWVGMRNPFDTSAERKNEYTV
jgi:hypothetical protein